ncbi:MAG TPA: twin-arginine translocase TatA/TatE family subunit [Pirellulales bacterium]|nr:twin-arginine translocase TatA/TatE family subunit [Pirellulales bacterium]
MIFAWLSPLHIFVVAIVVVVLFAHRIPRLMRSLGTSAFELKKVMRGEIEQQQIGGSSASGTKDVLPTCGNVSEGQ